LLSFAWVPAAQVVLIHGLQVVAVEVLLGGTT
jgi:hypothetical protein